VKTLDIFANAGSGFHSNDARDVVISRRISEFYKVGKRDGLSDAEIDSMLLQKNFDPAQRGEETLPRAGGGEIGFRTRLANRVNFAAAAWYLHLEREYVYVGDAGTTELSDPTNRHGLDFELRLGILPWLWGDVDVNISEGKIDGAPEGENKIPLAPNFTSTGGLTALHPGGFEGSFRYRAMDSRPANEDGSVVAKGYTVFDVFLGYRFGQVEVTAALENLFDSDWNEAQFDTESRLKDEPEPVSEIHFTPGNPRNLRLGIGYHF
jgi:outer membrane receptor protein involved in Fe transport